jgi:hypothetical protein
MSRRARCEVNADIEPVAADEPARGSDKYREQWVASRRTGNNTRSGSRW